MGDHCISYASSKTTWEKEQARTQHIRMEGVRISRHSSGDVCDSGFADAGLVAMLTLLGDMSQAPRYDKEES